MVSGGIAALISCPAEVTLVRISNDNTLPIESRRNYKGVVDAFQRILREEGSEYFHSENAISFLNREHNYMLNFLSEYTAFYVTLSPIVISFWTVSALMNVTILNLVITF